MKLATLCYLRRDNQTLMLHRVKKLGDYHKGKWNGLGGKMQPGETPEACVRREVHEESGINLKNPIMRGIITFPLFDGVDDWYCFLFTGSQFDGDMIDSPEGRLEWIDNNKLFDLPLWEGDYVFMRWLDQPRFFSACFIYKEKKLISHEVVFYSPVVQG